MHPNFSSLLLKTSDFIATHRSERPESVALTLANQGEKLGFDKEEAAFIVRQIEGAQKLSQKVPRWSETPQLVYPPRLSLEQCSSQRAAEYKAQLIEKIKSSNPSSSQGEWSMVDLTGGLGVDFSFIAPHFDCATYVEQREELVQLAQHNFPLLGLSQVECRCGDGVAHLSSMKPVNLVYLDPARRDENGRKTVRIEDCTPNVLDLLPLLQQKTEWLLVKLSPMLDVHQAIASLGCVSEVHLVAVDGECKEVLLLCHLQIFKSHAETSSAQGEKAAEQTIHWCCSSEKGEFCFTSDEEQTTVCPLVSQISGYLYEPDAAVMKAGAYKTFGVRYGLQKLHPNTHLYIGDEARVDIPARCFRIVEVVGFQKKALRSITALKKANLTVRNFPTTVAELRKRFKLAEGGEHYLFACTTANEDKVIIITEKATTPSVTAQLSVTF